VSIALALCCVAGVRAATPRLARLLADSDPAARLGGDTIIRTGAGDRILGVPHRPKLRRGSLGPNETIEGGNRDDNLAALKDGVTIIAEGVTTSSTAGRMGR
jgi:hypothetical protein